MSRHWRLWASLALVAFVALTAVPAQAQVSCTGVAAWNATTIYNAGDKVTFQGHLFTSTITGANIPPTYCPACGGWVDNGACNGGGGGGGGGTCSTLPSVPTGLTSPSKSSSSVSLSWNASTPGANCTVQYSVFQNGTQVTTVAGTSVTINGLAASTAF